MARRFQKPAVPPEEEVPIGSRVGIPLLPAVGLAALGLVSSGLLDLFSPFVRFLVVFALFSLLPGELFLRHAFPSGPVVTRLPLALASGISLFAVATWICWMSSVSFRTYLGVLQVVCAGLFGLSLLLSFRRRPRPGSVCVAPAQNEGRTVAVVWLAVALSIGVFFYVCPPAVNGQGDAFAHIGFIRSIVSQDTLTPEDVLARPVHAGGEVEKNDPRMGTLHRLLAAMTVLANVEPVELWRRVPVVMGPLAFLSFAGFASVLLPGAGYVAFALVLFLMFQGGIGREALGTIAYGQNLSLMFLWLFVVISLRCAREAGSRGLVLLGLIVLGGSLVHIGVAMHCALAWVGFLLFYRVFGFTPRRVLTVGLVTAVCAGLAVVWKMATSYDEGNILHTHPQRLLYFVDIGDRFFIPSPAEIIRKNGLLFFVGFLFVPFLPLLKRHRRYALMSLALSVPAVVTSLNPLVCPFLYGKVHYLVHRFVLNIPSFVVTSLVIGTVISWGRAGNIWRKTVAAVVLLLWARVFLIGADGWFRDARSVQFDRGAPVMSAEVAGVIRFINDKTPDKSVVLTDAVTSYMLSAFSHAKVVTVAGLHGSPNDRYPVERLSAVQTAMSPYTSQIRTLDVIEKFDVDYVLINGAFEEPYHDFLADWDPRFKTILEAKLGTFKGVFKRVYQTDEILVYKVEGTSFERISWDPVVPFFEKPPVELQPCEGSGGAGTVRVTGMRIEPREVLPGEEMLATVAYRRLRGARPSFPVVLRLRFEDKKYFEAARGYPGDKYVRRYRERRDGVFRRFRIDHRPFDGYFPPGEWRENGDCFEQFKIRLPVGLGETDYEVQWQLVEEPLLPNFSIRDFLFNDDSYVGTPCTKIEVRRHVVR